VSRIFKLHGRPDRGHFDPWMMDYGPDTAMALRLAHRLGPMFAVRQWQPVILQYRGQVYSEATRCDWDVLLPNPIAGMATVCFHRKTWCWGGFQHARSMTGIDRMQGYGARWIERIADSIREATLQMLLLDITKYRMMPGWERWVEHAQRSIAALTQNERTTRFVWKGETSHLMYDTELDKPVTLEGRGSSIRTDGADPELHDYNGGKVTFGIYLGRVVYERQHVNSGTGAARRWAREAVERSALRWRELPVSRTDEMPEMKPQSVQKAP
jgi:hypothetical protein